MGRNPAILYKSLVIGIFILLIGAGVVSSIGYVIENNNFSDRSLKSISSSEEILSRGKTAYAYIAYVPVGSEGPCYFDLDDPGDIELLAPTQSGDFLTGGTYSYEYGWFAVQYNNGILWHIDTDTGDMDCIGGGGVGVGDIAWDDCTSMLYGTSGNSFYEVDPESGGQTNIGGLSGIDITGLAFDSNCICYGVGYNGSALNLYTIEFYPLEITFVAPLTNFDFVYYCNAEFDKDIDVLYLINGGSLYTCDTETGECTFVGSFGGAELTALAIPYEYDDTTPPVTTHSLDPPEPDGWNGWYVSDVNVTLTATDDESGVKEIKYCVNRGPIRTIDGDCGNFYITQEDDADDVIVEYWAVDNSGNTENKNTFTIDMDQTPPTIDLVYEVIGGNWWTGWEIAFTVTGTDATSGICRVEFYFNDELQETVHGSGPTYSWSLRYWPIPGGSFKAIVYDCAGNYAEAVVNSSDIKVVSRSNFVNRYSNNVCPLGLLERFPLSEVVVSRIINL